MLGIPEIFVEILNSFIVDSMSDNLDSQELLGGPKKEKKCFLRVGGQGSHKSSKPQTGPFKRGPMWTLDSLLGALAKASFAKCYLFAAG